MFSSFYSATFRVFRNFLRWSQVASNLSALSSRAQKTILSLTILQRQMVEEVVSTTTQKLCKTGLTNAADVEWPNRQS
jgi:hypothetical protein